MSPAPVSGDCTTTRLNADSDNPDPEEITTIEVTDARHPLFGRRFAVLSISTSPGSLHHVYVSYREQIILRIPITATNLAPPTFQLPTKLTSQALEDLISQAQQCEVLCPHDQKKSGEISPPRSNNKSSRPSLRSSGR
jgi:hypothetical protein